jgi:hypothetical protein
MASLAPALIQSGLHGFHGSEEFYRHPLNRKVTWTEGVQFLAEEAGAYWLLDEIALANQYQRAVKDEEFQVWTLTLRNESRSGVLSLENENFDAVLTCGDSNGNTVYTQPIPFTDFPLRFVELYFENDVICLPTER